MARTDIHVVVPTVGQWEEALPLFSPGYYTKLKNFTEGKIENQDDALVFAGDYLGGPLMEGVFTSGKLAARWQQLLMVRWYDRLIVLEDTLMERMQSDKVLPVLPVVAISALLMSGCVESGTTDTEKMYPLQADQPVYMTEDSANGRGDDECSTLRQGITVRPESVADMGAGKWTSWLVLEINTSGITEQLSNPEACTSDSVYATFK